MSLRLLFKANIDFRIERDAMRHSDFKFDFVGLIPMISEAMAVPVFANLFQRLCVRNAASLICSVY